MSKRRLVLVSSLLAGFTLSACTAILVPGEDDDMVARCNTSEDCPDTGDERYVAQCVFGEGQPENSDKVCVVSFKEDVNCNPEAYTMSRFGNVWEDATGNTGKAAYVNCTADNLGKRGCAPSQDTGCETGLEANAEDFCDDPSAAFPVVNPAQFDDIDDVIGQDVVDQFCRAFFCDENFVCDRSSAVWTCRICSDSDEFGKGGCGELYLQGVQSTVYTPIDENGSSCGNGPDSVAKSDTALGEANEPPA